VLTEVTLEALVAEAVLVKLTVLEVAEATLVAEVEVLDAVLLDLLVVEQDHLTVVLINLTLEQTTEALALLR
jgi:hypothetical protein